MSHCEKPFNQNIADNLFCGRTVEAPPALQQDSLSGPFELCHRRHEDSILQHIKDIMSLKGGKSILYG